MLQGKCTAVVFCIIYCVKLVSSQQDLEFHFSHVALQMPESLGRRQIRQNWMIVPHLFKGDVIHMNICIEARSIVQINNITYSNDGNTKTISLIHDGMEVGRFDTHSDSDWGKLWERELSSGFVGQTKILNPGTHEILLKVDKTYDCYGFEPWSIHVRVFIPTDPKRFWCGSRYTLAEQPSTCTPDTVGRSGGIQDQAVLQTVPPLPRNYVTVKQHSYPSKCLDNKNVKILFTVKNLAGTIIQFQQDEHQPHVPQFREHGVNNISRLCNNEIWQLGKADDNNGEFKAIYSGKVLTVNLTRNHQQEDVFPAKLLPFVTTDIYINFELPADIDLYHGSAYFTLGLVNVTMPADIGLRYFDYTINNFSTMHVLSFTPSFQVMGWNIPNLGKTKHRNATIHLHFQSSANVLRFDFLRLDYQKRDVRQLNSVLARRGQWKVRGLRYETSTGMDVSVDNHVLASNIENAVLLKQFSSFSRYHTVLRLNADGTFYLYKAYVLPEDLKNELVIVDVSGFYFLQNVGVSTTDGSKTIRLVNLDTSRDVIIIHYVDGSVIHAQLTATLFETKMQITGFEVPPIDQKKLNNANLQINNAQGVVFVSTYINDHLAAVNTISTEGREKQIMENMDDYSGGSTFTFRKTSSDDRFYANNFIKVYFPK